MDALLEPDRWQLVRCDPPKTQPLIRNRLNPSRHYMLQAETSFRGLEAALDRHCDVALKIRTDMQFSTAFFKDLASIDHVEGKFFVKAYRPDTPWFFGDGILFAETEVLREFFFRQIQYRQRFVNTHFEHFRILLEMSTSQDLAGDAIPKERRLERGRLTAAQSSLSLTLWRSVLRLVPGENLYPLFWRGVAIDAPPAFEILNLTGKGDNVEMGLLPGAGSDSQVLWPVFQVDENTRLALPKSGFISEATPHQVKKREMSTFGRFQALWRGLQSFIARVGWVSRILIYSSVGRATSTFRRGKPR